MRWYCYSDAVPLLNEAKSRISRPVANSKVFKIHLNFASLPAVRPTSARCTAPEISQNKGNRVRFYETVVPMKIHPLRHGISFHPLLSSFSFSVPFKGEKIAKEGVDKLAPSVYFVTQETRDTISYAPAVNTILTDAMFLRVLYYIVNFIIRANIQ